MELYTKAITLQMRVKRMDLDKRLRQRMGSSAFTEAEVARIKTLLAKGHSRRQLAQAYDVALGTISKIAREETFAWVKPDDLVTPHEDILGREPPTEPIPEPSEALLKLAAEMNAKREAREHSQMAPPAAVTQSAVTQSTTVQSNSQSELDGLLGELK